LTQIGPRSALILKSGRLPVVGTGSAERGADDVAAALLLGPPVHVGLQFVQVKWRSALWTSVGSAPKSTRTSPRAPGVTQPAEHRRRNRPGCPGLPRGGQEGRTSGRAVAEHFSRINGNPVKAKTASNWVAHARRAGKLPPTTRGAANA
jgi:hypothetical protein